MTYASIDADFECAHARHDLVVWVLIVFVGYQLAVDVTHCIFLRNQIKDNVAFVWSDRLHNSGFHYRTNHELEIVR